MKYIHLLGLLCLQIHGNFGLEKKQTLRWKSTSLETIQAVVEPYDRSSPSFLSIPSLQSNWFFLAEICVLILAKCYPNIGKTGGSLRPEFWINKVGVVFIFIINGLSLSVSQLQSAGSSWGLHAFTQVYSLCVLPIIGWALASMIHKKGIQDGIRCLAALPSTINLSITLTQASGADPITAIFHSVIGNLIGVFWSPILVFWMLQAGQDVSLTQSLAKLAKLVLIPLFVGQLIRQTPVGPNLRRFKACTKTAGEIILLGVVLNTFSDTFLSGFSLSPAFIGLLFTATSMFYLSSNFIFWKITRLLFSHVDIRSRGAAMICSSQKTLAFGMPFIKATFGHQENVAEILTPLLLYYQVQVLLGSLILVMELKRTINAADRNK